MPHAYKALEVRSSVRPVAIAAPRPYKRRHTLTHSGERRCNKQGRGYKWAVWLVRARRANPATGDVAFY